LIAAKNGHVAIFKELLKYGAADEVYIGGQLVNVRDVVHVFNKNGKAVLKELDKHKLVCL
jgi:collagenase-like PrtC family protease